MAFFKVETVLALLMVFLIVGCKSNSRDTQRLQKEYAEVKKERDDAVKSAVRQLENINHVFDELETMNARIGNMRLNVKNKEVDVPLVQAQQIDSFLVNIKNELDQLELSNQQKKNKNQELVKTLNHLRTTIFEKEVEIVNLKDEMKGKDTLIVRQENTIGIKNQEITRRNQEIEQSRYVIKQKDKEIEGLQVDKWRQMGDELYTIYAEYNDISKGWFKGKVNQQRMNANKLNVLEKAKKCYSEAVSLGSSADNKNLQKIDNELNRLK